MTTNTLDEHQRDILLALRAHAAAGQMSTVAKINEALSEAHPGQANNLLRTLVSLVELCERHLVRAVLDTPSRWLLTEDGESALAEGTTVSPLEADLLLELDKVALATDAGPGDTLRRVIREAATAGELRPEARDATGMVRFTLSALRVVRVSVSPLVYRAGWYDYSGHEYDHVTAPWLMRELWQSTGVKSWAVDINHAGNGHYAATMTALPVAATEAP